MAARLGLVRFRGLRTASADATSTRSRSVAASRFRNWLRGEKTADGPDIQLDFTAHYERKLTERYNAWLAENRTAEEIARIREIAGVSANEPVPRLRREQFVEAPDERFYAEALFYTAIEQEFFLGMKSYLTETLGVESLIVGCADHTYWIPNQPMLQSTSLMDIVDGHVYWQHPAIWGARNTPMVNEPLDSTIVKLSRSAFLGKPFTDTCCPKNPGGICVLGS